MREIDTPHSVFIACNDIAIVFIDQHCIINDELNYLCHAMSSMKNRFYRIQNLEESNAEFILGK